jgi:ketosteroid isomerase-like protein
VSAPSSAVSNKDIVRSLYEAFGKGDPATVLAAFHANIVWNEAENHTFADGNPYKGANAILNGVFMRLAMEWEGFRVVPDQYTAEEARVIVEGRYAGKCKATGASIDAQFVHVWTLEGGKVTRFQQYTDTAQWQQATAPRVG